MNWLWKLFGYHVCEEFTQYEGRRVQCQQMKRSWVSPR